MGLHQRVQGSGSFGSLLEPLCGGGGESQCGPLPGPDRLLLRQPLQDGLLASGPPPQGQLLPSAHPQNGGPAERVREGAGQGVRLRHDRAREARQGPGGLQ